MPWSERNTPLLELVHSESAEERENRAVWDEIDCRIEAGYARWAERIKQEALVPVINAYEERLRRLEAQIPVLTLLQGQQMVIDLLMKQAEMKERGL